jgi:general secretion pathway protein L
VESLSPWQSADLLWGYRLIDSPASGEGLAIEIGMTGNEPVKALVTELKTKGIDVGSIEFSNQVDSAGTIKVYAASQAGPERRSRSILVVAIAGALCAILAGAVGSLQALTAHNDLQSADLQLQKLQAALDRHSTTNDQATPLAVAAALSARKQHDVPLITVLKELTQAIPDGSWLQSLSYSEGQLVINGKGEAASGIIAALEASPLLQDVNFAAATQRNPGDNQDSFSISAIVSSTRGAQ